MLQNDYTKEKNKSDFIRISGDSPLIYSKVINRAIETHRKSKRQNYDIITNVFPRSFPPDNQLRL